MSYPLFDVFDSRAIFINYMRDHPLSTTPLSTDHFTSDADEHQRVYKSGGTILGILINCYISVTRELVDEDLKSHRSTTHYPVRPSRPIGRRLFIGDADVSRRQLRPDYTAIVIDSDDVWFTLSTSDVRAAFWKAVIQGGYASTLA